MSKNIVIEIIYEDSDLHSTLLFADRKDYSKVCNILDEHYDLFDYVIGEEIEFNTIEIFGKNKNIRVLRPNMTDKTTKKICTLFYFLRKKFFDMNLNSSEHKEIENLHITTDFYDNINLKIKNIIVRHCR